MSKKINIFFVFVISILFFILLPKLNTVVADCLCDKWCVSSYWCDANPPSRPYSGFCSESYCCGYLSCTSPVQCGPGYYACNRAGNCCPIGLPPTDPPNPPGGGGCTAGPWTNVGCNWSPCDPGYMLQTRTTNPAGCITDWKCALDASCPVGSGESCSISAAPDPYNMYPSETKNVIPVINQNPGTVGAFVSGVSFYQDNATNFGVCDSANTSCTIGSLSYVDSTSAFTSKITASNNVGATATLAVDGTMNTGVTCANDYITLNIINNPSWCQAKTGDIIAVGSISCTIPASCTSPTCNPSLITYNTGDVPGIAVAGGTISDGSGTSVPPVAPNMTVEGDTYSGTTFDYAYFDKKASAISFSTIPVGINQTNLLSGSTYAGMHWKKATGNSTISGNVNLGTEKVILFVDGNLSITGPINLDDGRGFFMVVVNGNITVSSAVGGPQESPTALPDLEGLYFANGTFDSGTAGPSLDTQLHVRGAVAAGSFTLQRDLVNNSVTPGELFEFGPDQVMRLPSFLSRKQVIWREVAP